MGTLGLRIPDQGKNRGETHSDSGRSDIPCLPPGPPPWLSAETASRERPTSTIKTVLGVFVTLGFLGAVIFTFYSQRENMRAFLLQSGSTAPDQGPIAAVARSAVLYEEDPGDSQGKRYVGSAIWKLETGTPGEARAAAPSMRALIEIPEHMHMTMRLRRNAEKELPAPDAIEIDFNRSADSGSADVSDVLGILMKQAEQAPGERLAAVTERASPGLFIVRLSAAEADMHRSLQLLKEQPWFDIPIVYSSGQRAILAIEKGAAGEGPFEEVVAAW